MKKDIKYQMPAVYQAGLSYGGFAIRKDNTVIFDLFEREVRNDERTNINVTLKFKSGSELLTDKDILDIYFLIINFYESESFVYKKVYEIIQTIESIKISITEEN